MLPPLEPLLARLERALPAGDGLSFEPKWDGFRCLAFRDGEDVALSSRNERPLARYFPEVVAGLRRLRAERVVLDGELLVTVDGRVDFPALLGRLHPAASRVELLAGSTPAQYVVFDVLAVGDDDLRDRPFAERRAVLERLLDEAPAPLCLTTSTRDRAQADAWLDAPPGSGIDGVMAKADGLRWEAGRRSMVKVKRARTADCVVAGLRPAGPDEVGSLLLGLWDEVGVLEHVGVAGRLAKSRRRELADVLRPLVTELDGHPWEHGFGLGGGALGRLPGTAGRWTPDMRRDWVPVRPERVAEVAYDHLEGVRFRHPARFVRWRPDRDPASCRTEQLR